MGETRIAVRYFSKSGHTKKVADAIAKAVDCQAESISVPLTGKVELLFLGASVYWAGISAEGKDYIQTLDQDQIGKVVIFSTSGLAERAFPQMQKALLDRGLQVVPQNFYCRGEFTALHRGRPNAADLQAAEKFANHMVASIL